MADEMAACGGANQPRGGDAIVVTVVTTVLQVVLYDQPIQPAC